MQSKDLNRLRTLVFEKQETQQSDIIDYEIELQYPLVNLNSLFSTYCDLQKHKVSIYDPTSNKFVSLKKISSNNGYIPITYLQPKIVLFRYSKNNQYYIESDSLDSSMQREVNNDKKDTRSKERTISEVIQLVKKWRNLHLYGHKSINRRMNLQDAAKLVGISKKTLDDYYCQLRLGEFYEFDFANKLEQKIGILRSYVKQYKPDKQSKRRQNQKHPKNLKVIQLYSIQTKRLNMSLIEQHQRMESQSMMHQGSNQINQEKKISISKRQEEKQSISEISFFNQRQESQPIFQELFKIQNQFFKGFQYPFDEPQDPFFLIQRDFHKKTYEEDSNNSLFYF